MADRIGIIGLCLGSLITLHLAVESSSTKPRCIICISNVHSTTAERNINGFYGEIPKEYSKMRVDENNSLIWKDVGLALLKEPSMKLNVAEIDCPMLLLNGTDDQNWPSVEAAEDMAKMMRAGGKEHLLTKVEYPDAGHLIEPPFSPHFRTTVFVSRGSKEKAMLLWGGQTKPHSDAQEDSWKKILSFLRQQMYGNPVQKAKL